MAALGRVEHRINEIWSKIMESDRRSSMASVQSVNTILSYADGQPDQSGWNFIQQELVATGVSVEDIEDNKSQIIKYVKDLVNDSLSQPEVEVQQNLGPGGSVSATHSANRRAFLANLDLHKTRTLSIGGKASVDFRIETILHGTFSGRPACMIVTDFWFHSDPTYRGDKGSYVAAGHIFMTVSPVQGRVSGNPEDVPVLVNSAPELMRGLRYTYRGTFSTEGLCTIWTVQSMRGESHRRIEWNILGAPELSSYLNRRFRLVIVIEHGMSPFILDIETSQNAKFAISGRLLRKLVNSGSSPKSESFKIHPDEMGTTMLDEVDMKELLLAPEIIHQRDVDDTHQVTLEYNRKVHTIPLVAPEDTHFTEVGRRKLLGI